jgi:hypothetical protein
LSMTCLGIACRAMKMFIFGLLLGVALTGFAWWLWTTGLVLWPGQPETSWPALRIVPVGGTPSADGWACTLDDPLGSVMTFTRAGESHSLRSDPNTAWHDPIINADGTILFVILHNRMRSREGDFFDFRAVVKYELPLAGKPWSEPTATTLFDAPQLTALTASSRAWVSALHSMSDDAQRILVTVGVEDSSRSSAEATYSDYQPYVYDVAGKKLTKVRP